MDIEYKCQKTEGNGKFPKKMEFEYIFMRLIRRNMPRFIIRFLLDRSLIIGPGLETKYPQLAVNRYENELRVCGKSFKDSLVLIFGYGGYFATAVDLLKRGAKHIYLYDKYTAPNDRKNFELLSNNEKYLIKKKEFILPNHDFITIINEDIDNYIKKNELKLNIVLSSSVLEHITEIDNTINIMMKITVPDGINIHYVDLRDHFFKFPFHMLCYSKRTWERFLNADNNLNRLRIKDYEKIFKKYFDDLQCKIIESDLYSFRKVRHKIKPEFIAGEDKIDSATQIVLIAYSPKPIYR